MKNVTDRRGLRIVGPDGKYVGPGRLAALIDIFTGKEREDKKFTSPETPPNGIEPNDPDDDFPPAA